MCVSLLQSHRASCALTNDRLLQCIALFGCLGCTKATDGRAHVRLPPLCLLAVVVNADLGEVLSVQDAWPTSRHPLLWMGRSLSRMLMRQEEESEGRLAAAVHSSASILFLSVRGADPMRSQLIGAGQWKEGNRSGQTGLTWITQLIGFIQPLWHFN